MNKCASTSWSSCLWKFCELVSNIEEQLCIVFMYTGNLFHLHDLAIWKWFNQMCTFEVHLCMMSGQLILSGKPFNTFSNARSYYINPCYHAWHAFFFSRVFHHLFPMAMICDWNGVFFFLFSWPFIYFSYWFTVICEILKTNSLPQI